MKMGAFNDLINLKDIKTVNMALEIFEIIHINQQLRVNRNFYKI